MNFKKGISYLKENAHKKIFFAVLIFIFAFTLRLWHLNDTGRAWDEQFVAEEGYQYITLAKKLDFGNDYWWKQKHDHPVLVGYIRGIASQFDFVTRDANGKPVFTYDLTYNRLASVVLTSLTAVLVFLIGFAYISLFVGICAGIILSMLPILLGHSQLGMYEPFIIFFFTLTTYSFLLFLESPTKKRVAITGILLGLSMQAKETNALLAPLFLLIYFIRFLNVKEKPNIKDMLIKISSIFIISIITFFALWPMALIHLDFMIHYILIRRFDTWASVPEVFFGKLLLVPRVYYIVYFLITTPFLILVFFLTGLLKINKQKKWILYVLVLWFVFPFLQSLYPNRQQGIRYIIEIYSPLALIAAIGFDSIIGFFTKKTLTKLFFFIPIILYLFISIIRIAPYYLEYFNGLVGGVNNVYEKRLFQFGGWGEGIKEAALYVEKIAPKDSTVGLALDPKHTVPPLKTLKITPYEKVKIYDFVIVNYYFVVRDGFDESALYGQYKLIHSIKADKARLVDIFQKR
jgi:4-amino-4-deoxy-L-arabinose transferase-like glycosyltransferase